MTEATYEFHTSTRSLIFRLPEMFGLEYASARDSMGEPTARLFGALMGIPGVEKVKFFDTTSQSINIIVDVDSTSFSAEMRLQVQAVIQEQIPELTFVPLLAFKG